MAKALGHISRLPSAPLAEVVFELRWALQSYPNTPIVFQTDPGLPTLIERFTVGMKRAGFGTFKDMGPLGQMGGHSVARRYYKAADAPFPLMQIGPGIFASNDSHNYEWKAFKAQVLRGLRILLRSYPAAGEFKLIPSHLEIRYIDVFDKKLLGRVALFDFLREGTTLSVNLPRTLTDKSVFAGHIDGRLLIQRDFKGRRGTRFTLDIGSAKRDGEHTIRMESKAVCTSEVPKLRSGIKFLKDVGNWMEFVHDFTSPFFKAFVSKTVMEKFKQKQK